MNTLTVRLRIAKINAAIAESGAASGIFKEKQ
jgi:hypothetical protein